MCVCVSNLFLISLSLSLSIIKRDGVRRREKEKDREGKQAIKLYINIPKRCLKCGFTYDAQTQLWGIGKKKCVHMLNRGQRALLH